jgi:mono/diheme cytochrome c family protein
LGAKLEKTMTTRSSILICALLLTVTAEVQSNPGIPPFSSADDPQKSQIPPTYVPSGKTMYKHYCAACHGADGKGRGPATPTLNTRVPDLTTLAKRHDGKFPYDYVANVLRFGPGFSAHGAADMPVWGPIFQYLENYNEAAVRQRIKNLCDYLESMQEK